MLHVFYLEGASVALKIIWEGTSISFVNCTCLELIFTGFFSEGLLLIYANFVLLHDLYSLD